ncbi:hypothetical protein Cylst_0172 [Cylindrospermum stagnale PCC 7417]|uniref:NB-ARC domain-containing protein n=1 Tax=Cylindrospermum stagnale PCC 7417 TaxID=56107 RepID=K9WRZ3_9NOST|nr:ATP-binding protein [Cylindrospermum stagnale]AFZ22549.1 hypothetical protein Cylst_0172 [Cylindrospermum stagnale PCC 7417]
MASIHNSPEEKFTEAVDDWDLDRLYKDLKSSKQQVAPHKTKGLTAIEKLHLRGLLCGNSPVEMAKKLHKQPRGLEADLSQTLYRYVEKLTDRPTKTVKNWRDICEWLEEAGYKTSTSHSGTNPQPQKSSPEREIASDSDFVGREEDIAQLNNLVNEGAKVILIKAEGGIGKTTLAQKWFEIQGLKYLELRVGTTSQNLNSVEDWVRFQLKNHFDENPEHNFMMMLEQFKTKLQEKKPGILIDNLEPVLKNGQFIETHKNYVDLLILLADKNLQSITLITTREQIDESKILPLTRFKIYDLQELSLKTWQEYFKNKEINIDNDSLNAIWRNYGGNAAAMDLLTADILKESQGDLKAYWQDNSEDLLRHRSLEQLVQSQFDKLRNDNLQAYKLLYRLGCYRYNYISTIPEEGLLCLLWDEPSERGKRRVVRELRESALVKFRDNQYYLYQVICQEAIDRIKLHGEWEKSHGEAGIFWGTFLSGISENYQFLIPKVIYTQGNNSQEQMYLNIDNAEKAANSNLNKLENVALEIVYHAGEFYHSNSFEELILHPKLSNNPFAESVIQMIFEYVECYEILGISLNQYGLITHILAVCDERECYFTESLKEFEYCQKSFEISKLFFQTALLIAKRVKHYNLVSKVSHSLAESHYYRGISLHHLGLYLHHSKIIKEQQSKVAFQESRSELEKSLQIYNEIQDNQEAKKVQQAIQSLLITIEYCS